MILSGAVRRMVESALRKDSSTSKKSSLIVSGDVGRIEKELRALVGNDRLAYLDYGEWRSRLILVERGWCVREDIMI